MIFIGIDTGVHTGFAVWHSDNKYLSEVSTYTITQAMERIKMIANVRGRDDIVIYIEDARQRKWFGRTGRERLKGAGSVCRDAKIWQDWCAEQGIECRMMQSKRAFCPIPFLLEKGMSSTTGCDIEATNFPHPANHFPFLSTRFPAAVRGPAIRGAWYTNMNW